MRALIQQVVEDVLESEMDEALGAQKEGRTVTRVGFRSGYYTRTLATRMGKLVQWVGLAHLKHGWYTREARRTTARSAGPAPRSERFVGADRDTHPAAKPANQQN